MAGNFYGIAGFVKAQLAFISFIVRLLSHVACRAGCFVSLGFIVSVFGHGRLIDPASRNAAWRYGFDNPVHFTDNELNCGGLNRQWNKNNGNCGVCGDPYDIKKPEFIHPGEYAKGIITKTYRKARRLKLRYISLRTTRVSSFFVWGILATPNYRRKADVRSKATQWPDEIDFT